jgi:AcrR family transcriptional regulator
MTRITKQYDERRAEIVSVASMLFTQKGYSETSIDAIVQTVGVAKGTFYHYFKSKQLILRAIIDSIVSDVVNYYQTLIDDNDLSATEKLTNMLAGSEKMALIQPEIMQALHKPENRELQEQMNIVAVTTITPMIVAVVEQGYEKGEFSKTMPSTTESVQLLLAGNQFILDSGLFEWQQQKQQAFFSARQALFEMLLGVETGTFSFLGPKESKRSTA